MWTVKLIKSSCFNQWSGWCKAAGSDKIYISMCLRLAGKSTTFNMYQRRGAKHLTVDVLNGNFVSAEEGKKSGRYNQSIPVLDYDHALELFCEYLNSKFAVNEKAVQKMDGEYYLWKLKDGYRHDGFDAGIEYWGEVGMDADKTLAVKVMNREGEWVFMSWGIITPSLTTA